VSVCACSYLIFAAQNQGAWGAEKEGGKKGETEVRGQPAWCGWFRARASARCRSQSGQQRPPRPAPPGLPPAVLPARRPASITPWRAPWWTVPPATISSARTGLRTWRSATSATATPGTDPLSPCLDPSQIRAAPPPESLAPPARFHAHSR
jgi:hypothetical protein